MSLSQGAIQTVYNNDTSGKHTLQLLDIKKINASGPGTMDRYRLVISDGHNYMQAVLATQLNPLVESGQARTPTATPWPTSSPIAISSIAFQLVSEPPHCTCPALRCHCTVERRLNGGILGNIHHIRIGMIHPFPASAGATVFRGHARRVLMQHGAEPEHNHHPEHARYRCTRRADRQTDRACGRLGRTCRTRCAVLNHNPARSLRP